MLQLAETFVQIYFTVQNAILLALVLLAYAARGTWLRAPLLVAAMAIVYFPDAMTWEQYTLSAAVLFTSGAILRVVNERWHYPSPVWTLVGIGVGLAIWFDSKNLRSALAFALVLGVALNLISHFASTVSSREVWNTWDSPSEEDAQDPAPSETLSLEPLRPR